MNIYWIHSLSWSYAPYFNFWNIDHLTYWLYAWDILLMVMISVLLFTNILWLSAFSWSDSPDISIEWSWSWNLKLLWSWWSHKRLWSWTRQLWWWQKQIWPAYKKYNEHWSFKIYR